MLSAHQANALTKAQQARWLADTARPVIAEVEALINAAIARGDYCIRMPLENRFNNSEVSRHLREHGYKVEFGSARKRAFVVSWGNPRSVADADSKVVG